MISPDVVPGSPRGHSHTQGTHCLPTTPPPTGPNSKNRTISIPGQHVRGHSPAGTARLPPRGHTACTQRPPDRKHWTDTAHNGCTNSCHRPPPTGGPDGDDLFGCATIPGDTALPRGTQPYLGGHSLTFGDTALPSGTQPHSGDTATLRGHTLPAPNAPHPARTAKTAHNCTQAQNQRLARPTAAGCPQRMAPPRTGLTPLTAASPAFAAVAASHATSGHSSHPSNGKTPAPQDAAESEKSPTQSPAESPQQQHPP